MDYKEEYLNALERAKMILCNLPEGSSSERDIETIFPELKASEDERIRKEMLEYFKDKKEKLHYLCFECGDVKYAPFSEAKQIDDFLAYLEKQKEQKLASNTSSCLNCAKWGKCKGGLTPCSGWKLKTEEPKPAEWSEEDEKMRNNTILSLQSLIDDGINDEFIKGVKDEITWLKSLRPQPHWKPSEEQMEALELAIEGKWDAILPTGYMSRRLEDLAEGLANTFGVECNLKK